MRLTESTKEDIQSYFNRKEREAFSQKGAKKVLTTNLSVEQTEIAEILLVGAEVVTEGLGILAHKEVYLKMKEAASIWDSLLFFYRKFYCLMKYTVWLLLEAFKRMK